MSLLSKIKKVAKKVSQPVRAAGHFVDLTSSKSLGGAGKYVAPIVRPAVGTAATALTGGAAALNPKIRGWAKTGYKIGATVGTAIASGKVSLPKGETPANNIPPPVVGNLTAGSGGPTTRTRIGLLDPLLDMIDAVIDAITGK